jgi:hypothetical protein
MSYYSYIADTIKSNDNLTCTNCKCNLYEGILKNNKLYCSDICYEDSLKKTIIINEPTINNPIKINKSISYICNGCKDKFYESEQSRIEKYGSYWCSEKCTNSIMFNSFIKRQLNN